MHARNCIGEKNTDRIHGVNGACVDTDVSTCARTPQASPHSTSGTTGTRSSDSQVASLQVVFEWDGIVMQQTTEDESQWPVGFTEGELFFRVLFSSFPISLPFFSLFPLYSFHSFSFVTYTANTRL